MTKKKESGDLPFSWEKIQAEIDANRSKTITLKSLTDEQRRFIVTCRVNGIPIPFPKMAEMWQKFGWGTVNDNTIQSWAAKLLR